MQERYSRQVLFKEIGLKVKVYLRKTCAYSRYGCVRTHLAEGLVRAGINKLTIVDRDYIEFSNLQRQTLFIERDAEDVLPK